MKGFCVNEAYLCGLANYAQFDLSVQAVLDKLPTAKIIERSGGKYTLEAEVYGDGIKMWILSQGSRIKVTEPLEFVRELKEEILTMSNFYDDIK